MTPGDSCRNVSTVVSLPLHALAEARMYYRHFREELLISETCTRGPAAKRASTVLP